MKENCPITGKNRTFRNEESYTYSIHDREDTMSRIVVITGSPHMNESSMLLAEAFIKSAKKQGHSVDRFDAAHLNLSGCRGCESCFRKGTPCSFDDDFNRIAPLVERADGLVYAFPVYWYTAPSSIKAFIDKFFSYYYTGRDFEGKHAGLLTCCEDADPGAFGGVRFLFEQSIAKLKMENIGEVLISGVQGPGGIRLTDGLRQAADLAARF